MKGLEAALNAFAIAGPQGRSSGCMGIVAICEFGRVSTLAAATLREIGFQRAIALDGGMKAWREAGYPLTAV